MWLKRSAEIEVMFRMNFSYIIVIECKDGSLGDIQWYSTISLHLCTYLFRLNPFGFPSLAGNQHLTFTLIMSIFCPRTIFSSTLKDINCFTHHGLSRIRCLRHASATSRLSAARYSNQPLCRLSSTDSQQTVKSAEQARSRWNAGVSLSAWLLFFCYQLAYPPFCSRSLYQQLLFL